MKHYLLQPEVGGGLGDQTVVDRQIGQPASVSALHCELDGWLGDDLVEMFPCFVVTEALRDALVAEGLSGFTLADVIVTSTRRYAEVHPGQTLPKFYWLQVIGAPNKSDFWMENDQSLAVSDRAWGLLKNFNLVNCKVRQQ